MKKNIAAPYTGTPGQEYVIAGRARNAVAIIGSLGIALILLVTVFNAIARRLGVAFVQSFDLLQFLLVIAMSGTIIYTKLLGTHIKVDFLVNKLSAVKQRILNIITCSVTTVVSGIIFWSMLQGSLSDLHAGLRYTTMPLPISVPKAILAACFLSFAIVEGLQVRSLLRQRKGFSGTSSNQ